MTEAKLAPFYEALMSFLALSKQQIFTLASEYGLTGTQTFMLMVMRDEQPKAMNSFCEMLGCDPSNITGLVDGLERKGLVSRTSSESDRRVKMLELLPRGHEIRSNIMQRMADRNKSYILSKLTAQEIDEFIALIQKITTGCPMESLHKKTKNVA